MFNDLRYRISVFLFVQTFNRFLYVTKSSPFGLYGRKLLIYRRKYKVPFAIRLKRAKVMCVLMTVV